MALPSYVARRTQSKFSDMDFDEILVGIIENNPGITQTQLFDRLIKDGILKRYHSNRRVFPSVFGILVRLEREDFLYRNQNFVAHWYVTG